MTALGMAFNVHDYEMNDTKDVQGIHLCHLWQSSALWICIVRLREKDQQRAYLVFCTLGILYQSTHLA